MGAVKITAADSIFSKCVRLRANWRCERCGAQHEEGSQGLHCSHYHGRGKWSTRFDANNATALCYGCHRHMGAHPALHEEFQLARLGHGLMQILREKANSTSLGRIAKRSKREIAAHYRAEYRRMEETGCRELASWS